MTDHHVARGDCLGYGVDVYADSTGGYYALIPECPGCGSQGETVSECFTNVEDALEVWLACRREGEK